MVARGQAPCVRIGPLLHWLRFLLAEHYTNGLPPLLAEQVEAALKSAGQWFPDPQLVYDPEPN